MIQRLVGLIVVAVVSAAGGQSVEVINGNPSATLPSSDVYRGIGNTSMRMEARITNYTIPFPVQNRAIRVGPEVFNGFYTTEYFGFYSAGEGKDTIANNGTGIPYTACCSRGDTLVRGTRDVANGKLILEVWDTQSGAYFASSMNLSVKDPDWRGLPIMLYPGVRIAFLRWFSSTVPAGTPVRATGVTGDLGDWEFDGDSRDSSGNGLDLTGGTVSYTDTPASVPTCVAGNSMVFRAGVPATLDGTQSFSPNGSAPLSYSWQQASGPSTVTWSSHEGATPTISGLVFGSYVFQLTVTDADGLSSSPCTVKHGAVETDDNDIVVLPDSRITRLIGPQVRLGSPKNPWPFFDTSHLAGAARQIALQADTYRSFWDAPGPGTISVVGGSTTITGTDTTFTTTFCQGPDNPTVPKTNAAIWIWHPAPGTLEGTGRKQFAISSCADDTHMTVSQLWAANVPDSPAMQYSYINLGDSLPYAWGYNQESANYYDNVVSFYTLYYRTGIDDYLTAARNLADLFWRYTKINLGYAAQDYGGGWPWRSRNVMGLTIRALDGRQDMFDVGMKMIWDAAIYEITQHGYQPQYRPGLYDTREDAYALAVAAFCAMYGDDTYKAKCKKAIRDSFGYMWTPVREAFPDHNMGTQWYGIVGSWNTGTSIQVTNGSSTISGNGTSWTASTFLPSPEGRNIWFHGVVGSRPGSNSEGDPTAYHATYIDATHAMLDRPYEGQTNTAKGYTLATNSDYLIGWGAQPLMIGILGEAFDLAYDALKDDPAYSDTAQLALQYQQETSDWIRTYGYDSAGVGLFYGAQFANCPYPITLSNTGCQSSGPSALVAFGSGGLVRTYARNADPAFRDFFDSLFNAQWAKPGTCTGSPCSDAPSTYLREWNPGGWYVSGPPPQQSAPKYFGLFFGFTGSPSWLAVRMGGPQSIASSANYVGFNLKRVPGAKRVRVTTRTPVGTVTVQECGASPCAIPSKWAGRGTALQLQYLSSTGSVLATSAASFVKRP